jgi:hypothetical protein
MAFMPAWSGPRRNTKGGGREQDPPADAVIGRTLQSVSIKTDEHILLDFGEATLTIALDEDNLHGPEAAHFFPVSRDGISPREGMMIW